MQLTGSQYEKLRDALVEAFPLEERLNQLLKFRLDKDFYKFKRGSDYLTVVFYLIQDTQAEGWVDKLLVAAR